MRGGGEDGRRNALIRGACSNGSLAKRVNSETTTWDKIEDLRVRFGEAREIELVFLSL